MHKNVYTAGISKFPTFSDMPELPSPESPLRSFHTCYEKFLNVGALVCGMHAVTSCYTSHPWLIWLSFVIYLLACIFYGWRVSLCSRQVISSFLVKLRQNNFRNFPLREIRKIEYTDLAFLKKYVIFITSEKVLLWPQLYIISNYIFYSFS